MVFCGLSKQDQIQQIHFIMAYFYDFKCLLFVFQDKLLSNQSLRQRLNPDLEIYL